MALSYKTYDFPTLAVRAQLFYPGGQNFDAGFTAGGVRVGSPEPGGRSYLEMELSLQVNEWETPFFSWIMSKINGEIFRVRLIATPQLLAKEKLLVAPNNGIPWDNNQPWNNNQNWEAADVSAPATETALEGTVFLKINMSAFGNILKVGHVIGVGNASHMVDEINYSGSVATIVVNPPLRKDIGVNERILFRPIFTGVINNGGELRTAYEANNVGHIKPNRIVFSEVML